MVLVAPWRVRAEEEVVDLPSRDAEAWARFDTFFEEERQRLFKALYFVTATDQLMKLDIGGGSDLQAAAPQVMFSTNSFLLAPYHQSFNISADGQSFIFAQPVNPSASEEYATVLLDWLPTDPAQAAP